MPKAELSVVDFVLEMVEGQGATVLTIFVVAAAVYSNGMVAHATGEDESCGWS